MKSGEILHDHEFVSGVLYASHQTDPGFLVDSRSRTVDAALADAYQGLLMAIDARHLPIEPHFHIQPHPIHGDSETVWETMTFLHSIEIIRPLERNPRYYTFQPQKYNALGLHERARANDKPEIYRQLAGRFLRIINGETVGPIPKTN